MKKILIMLSILFFMIISLSGLMAQQAEQEKFTLGGFFAVSCLVYNFDEKRSLATMRGDSSNSPTFSQSDLNIYFMYNSRQDWLAFSEIKFAYSPGGTYNFNMTAAPYGAEFNNSLYYEDKYRSYDMGGIFIERAYLEYNKFDFAKARMGRFFTPFGIYSQDHGAPAVVSIMPPMLTVPHTEGNISSHGMVLQQTGAELFGDVYFGDYGINYAVYMTNGPSENPNTNNDKVMATGGFLNFVMPTLANMLNIEFGGSVLQDKRSFVKSIPINTNSYTADPEQTKYSLKQKDLITAYHIKTSVSHLPLDGTFLIQAEYLQQKITDREQLNLFGYGSTKQRIPNNTYNAMYVQLQYKLLGIWTPYFRYDREYVKDKNVPYLMLLTGCTQYTAGLNIKPVPNVSLKFEYNYADWVTASSSYDPILQASSEWKNTNNDWKMYGFQASLAFL